MNLDAFQQPRCSKKGVKALSFIYILEVILLLQVVVSN